MDWVDLVELGNVFNLLIVAVLIFITGGAGAALINSITASKRGVKGDALVKEQNGIAGLGKLTEAQSQFIKVLQEEMADLKNHVNEAEKKFNEKVDDLEKKLEHEIEYSNLLARTLAENTVPIPPRTAKHRAAGEHTANDKAQDTGPGLS